MDKQEKIVAINRIIKEIIIMKKDELTLSILPVNKTVKTPVYSSLRFKDGKLVGEIKGYLDTPIEWLKPEKKVH